MLASCAKSIANLEFGHQVTLCNGLNVIEPKSSGIRVIK